MSQLPDEPSSSTDVCAVVVSYFPDVDRLLTLVGKLCTQGCRVVVVDNGSPMDTVKDLLTRAGGAAHWICLPDNQGVGAAQNAGIRYAQGLGSRYVALFDHDSDPADDLMAQLRAVAHRLDEQRVPIAAIGANYHDARQLNPPPFIRTYGGRLHRMQRRAQEPYVEVDYVIASGSLIPVRSFDGIGLMDESLFIDYVDIEWGLRARARGYASFGAWDAKLNHDLGDEPVTVLGKAYPARSPGRYYYMYRNVWALMRRPYIPKGWKFVESYRLILRAVVWVLWARGRRRQNFRAILRGMRDGWRGRLGPDLESY